MQHEGIFALIMPMILLTANDRKKKKTKIEIFGFEESAGGREQKNQVCECMFYIN